MLSDGPTDLPLTTCAGERENRLLSTKKKQNMSFVNERITRTVYLGLCRLPFFLMWVF